MVEGNKIIGEEYSMSLLYVGAVCSTWPLDMGIQSAKFWDEVIIKVQLTCSAGFTLCA